MLPVRSNVGFRGFSGKDGEASLPAGEEGQVIGYGPGGVPMAVDLPQGGGGEQGPPGRDGSSAYDIAVAAGFAGTEAEWLASLVGPKGDSGESIKGDRGDDGASAYEVALATGFVGTEAEWLASLVGPKGDKGDAGASVKGDKGDKGDPGAPAEYPIFATKAEADAWAAANPGRVAFARAL